VKSRSSNVSVEPKTRAVVEGDGGGWHVRSAQSRVALYALFDSIWLGAKPKGQTMSAQPDFWRRREVREAGNVTTYRALVVWTLWVPEDVLVNGIWLGTKSSSETVAVQHVYQAEDTCGCWRRWWWLAHSECPDHVFLDTCCLTVFGWAPNRTVKSGQHNQTSGRGERLGRRETWQRTGQW